MLDSNQIFSLFEEQPNTEIELINIENIPSPYLLIKIFKKIIFNYSKFSDNLILSLVGQSPEFDSIELKNTGYYITYTKAFNCISKIDIENKEHIVALRSLNIKNDLEICLDLSIQFFLEYEEYEKCTLLQNILLELWTLPF